MVSGFQSVKPERLLNDPHSQGLTVKNKRLRGSSGPSTPQAPSCLGLACLLLEAPPPALLGQLLPVPPTSGHPPRPPQARGPDTLFTSSSRQSLEVSAAPLDGGSHTPTEQLLREQGRREWTKARTQVCRAGRGHSLLGVVKVQMSVAQLCPTLCDPTDCSPPGSPDHGVLQARVLEWAAMPFSRASSRPRDRTWVSRTIGSFFTI